MSVSFARRSFLRGSRSLAPEQRPPWTDASFTEACIRCGDCIDACPENILFKGDGGFPQISFESDGCTFCEDCVNACQEPVFDLSREAFPWRARFGDGCLALANIHCQSCQDACETDAIRFTPSRGHVPIPDIALDDCTGCGACLAVCPQDAIDLVVPTDKDSPHA